MGLAGPTSTNRQSCKNLKISFLKLSRQGEKYFLETVLAGNFKF